MSTNTSPLMSPEWSIDKHLPEPYTLYIFVFVRQASYTDYLLMPADKESAERHGNAPMCIVCGVARIQ